LQIYLGLVVLLGGVLPALFGLWSEGRLLLATLTKLVGMWSS
jgi:hypothetical protein